MFALRTFILTCLVCLIGVTVARPARFGSNVVRSEKVDNLKQATRKGVVARGTRTNSALHRRQSLLVGQFTYAQFADLNAGGVS